MSLPQPKLDDKTFDVLVEESTRMIPRYAPEWTDHNRHDPGLTLVELFAWLTEMQQFYLDSIGPASYLKFLKLLGTKPRAVNPARTEINFSLAESVVAQGIDDTATSLTVTADDGAKFPGVPFHATIWNATDFVDPSSDSHAEIVLVTAVSGDTLTVRRAQNNTKAVAHNRPNTRYGIITGTTGEVSVPAGTKLANSSLQTEGQLIFETLGPLLVLSLKLKRVLTSTLRGLKDNTGANDWDGLSYFAFGEEGETESRLYLGFDRAFPAGEQIGLTFDLIEDYEVPRGRHGGEDTPPVPSALVTWEYYNDRKEWAPLEIVAAIDRIVSKYEQSQSPSEVCCFGAFEPLRDEIQSEPAYQVLSSQVKQRIVTAIEEARGLFDLRRLLFDPEFLMAKGDKTLMFSQSGRLFFPAPENMGQYEGLSLAESKLFWLRATVRQAGFELAPKVDSISVNTIDAIQRDTLSEVTSFSSSGMPNQVLVAKGYLAAYEKSLVQVRERDGRWKDWQARSSLNQSGANDRHFVIAKDPTAGAATLTFGDGQHGKIPAQGENQIRLISFPGDFEEEQKLGSSNGLTDQSFLLERVHVMPASLTLQVLEIVNPPLTSTEVKDLPCLFTFKRTTSLKSDQKIEVRLSLTAKTELCEVAVHENVEENPPDLEGIEHREFEVGHLATGLTWEHTYTVESAVAGAIISGSVSFILGAGCAPATEDSPVSTVDVTSSGKDLRWRDWVQVDDFDASGPGDPHFIFDPVANAVRFGDGINGEIPPALEQDGELERNLRIASLQTCEAENGNVVRNTIGEFANPNLPAGLLELKGAQVIAATGGAAAETIAGAQARARKDLRTQYQALTSDDFEFLAINTPGLRVSRVKAIPCFSAGGKDPSTSVTVVVLPYGTSAKPVPSDNFLLNVCRHLDRHRLITTQVEVVAPVYVRVTVQATVLLVAGFKVATAQAAIISALNRFLRPIPEPGDTQNRGWPFGRTVFKSEVYELIEKVEGVDCVERIVLTGEGPGAGRDANGNITITRTSVVYSGNHQVDVVAPELQCRSTRE